MTPPSLLVAGTDTGAGKTTLAALLLHADKRYSYWKPVQSGPPDSEAIRTRCPDAVVHAACATFAAPAAPHVAAAAEGRAVPDLQAICAALPAAPVVVESFGGPLSPLTGDVLQAALFARLGLPCVLVAPDRVGAIHQSLAALAALRQHGVACRAVVLLGVPCGDNAASIARFAAVPVFQIAWPADDSPAGYAARAADLAPLLAVLRTAPAGPAAGLRDLDRRHVWPPYSPLGGDEDRPVCVRAEREFLHLDTGERLVDGVSSWWTCLHGHAHPGLREALHAAAQELDQVLFAGLSHEPGIRLAAELCAFLPQELGRVFFSDNGSTAVEVALKIVHGAWRRRGAVAPGERELFVGMHGGYHGDTFGTLAVGRDPLFAAEYQRLLFATVQIPYSAAALRAALAEHGRRLAGVVLEPLLQAAGGMRMHPPDELRAICAVARAAGLPLIFDEVMTGFGRTGRMFAHQHLGAGFAPDVLCLAKGLSGGVLPLAATVVSDAIAAPWLDGDRARMLFHGHSYTANPLACATARRSLELFRSGAPLRDAARIERFFRERLLSDPPPGARGLRVLGTVAAFEIGTAGYLSDTRAQVIDAARREGVFLRPLGDTVYAMPPLCTSDASLLRIELALRRVAGLGC